MRRELYRVTTRPIYLIGMVLLPIISMFTLLSIMGKGLPSSLPLAVVDEDNTNGSRALVRNINAFAQTQVVAQTLTFREAREAMQRGEVYGIMVVPKRFEADATAGRQPIITCYTNNAYLMAGSLLFRDMKMIAELASGKVVLEFGQARGLTMDEIMGKAQPIVVEDTIIGNPWLNYSIYLNSSLLPGIIQLLVLQITAFGIGIEIKERSARRWLKSAGDSIAVALLGKLAVQALIFMITGMFCLSMLYGYYDFPLNSGIGPMALGLLLFIFASQAIGVFFVTLIPILRLALSLASLFGMLSFSIAGFSFPTSAMYAPVQMLANLFPLRHYYMIYVDQALNGRAMVYTLPYYAALLLFLLLPIFTLKNLDRELRQVPYIA